MKFIRTNKYIINAQYIRSVFESHNDENVCVVHRPDGEYDTFSKQEWNKAVRDAGVPSLQWIDQKQQAPW